MIDSQGSQPAPRAGSTPGYTVPPTSPQASAPADPSRPRVRWVGDSYVDGTGADVATDGYAYIVSDTLGWNLDVDASGGTGFIATGPASDPLKTAAERLPASGASAPADIVIIDDGRNDEVQYPVARIESAYASYVQRVRHLWPHADIIAITPFFTSTSQQFDGGELERFIVKTVRHHGGTVIDPNTEGWLPAPRGSTSADTVHPTTAGHAYIAKHLISDFRALGVREG